MKSVRKMGLSPVLINDNSSELSFFLTETIYSNRDVLPSIRIRHDFRVLSSMRRGAPKRDNIQRKAVENNGYK